MTAGYICAEPRRELYRHMDAANVDLKAFTESFYRKICGGTLARRARHAASTCATRPSVWFEITTLLIPGENDSDREIDELSSWVVEHLGPDVPLHFTAFHPDWKMLDHPPTPPATLTRARAIALGNGLRYVYTGNVHDRAGGTTHCHGCGAALIERDWYQILGWNSPPTGAAAPAARAAPASSRAARGLGAKRKPVRLRGASDR